jgi:hypothetical protein
MIRAEVCVALVLASSMRVESRRSDDICLL